MCKYKSVVGCSDVVNPLLGIGVILNVDNLAVGVELLGDLRKLLLVVGLLVEVVGTIADGSVFLQGRVHSNDFLLFAAKRLHEVLNCLLCALVLLNELIGVLA